MGKKKKKDMSGALSNEIMREVNESATERVVTSVTHRETGQKFWILTDEQFRRIQE